jgi:hypothetical protein
MQKLLKKYVLIFCKRLLKNALQRVSLKVINNKMDFPSESAVFDPHPVEPKEEPMPELKAEPVSTLKLRFTLG